MRWKALGLAVGLALAVPAAALATIAGGGNLIRNGGAEIGPVSQDDATVSAPVAWATTGNFTAVLYVEPGATIAGSIGAAVSAAVHGGRALFAGGPSNTKSSAAQTVVIPRSSLAAVAAGRARATVSAALGGWQGQPDAATVTYQWLDAGGKALGVTTLGPVTPQQRANETKLLSLSRTVAVPAATRSVRVTITAAGAGGYNDGYADNVSLVIR